MRCRLLAVVLQSVTTADVRRDKTERRGAVVYEIVLIGDRGGQVREENTVEVLLRKGSFSCMGPIF